MITVLRNADVFAPEPRGVQDLLVAGGQIVWIGRDLPPLSPELGAVERDLDGLRLIPGLVDGHVHVTGGGGEGGARTQVPPLSLTQFTLGGTTTVVGLLGTDDTTRSTANLLARVRALREEGLSAYALIGGYHLPLATLTGTLRGDLVNLEPVIGVGEIAVSDHRSSQPTLDELLRIGAEAHVAGLLSGKAGIVHLHVGGGPRGLELVRLALDRSELPARVWNPTHVNRRRALFEEACEVAERGSTIDVTAYPSEMEAGGWSAAEAIARYLGAGLPSERLTASSDGGGSLPVFDAEGGMTRMEVGDPKALAGTLQALLRAGRTLEQVLPVFTSNVARHLRLPTKGCVALGADADLAVLSPEGSILDVMARGRWHVLSGVPVVRGTFETEN